jgi:hypothetical protein
MIFQHTYQLVLSQQKTQTRRVVQPTETAVRGKHNRILSVQVNGRDKWRVGSTYAIQIGRGKSQIGRIKLSAINNQMLQTISTKAAIAEGFSSRTEFFQTWKRIHGDMPFTRRVWVLTFELDISTNKNAHKIYNKARTRLKKSQNDADKRFCRLGKGVSRTIKRWSCYRVYGGMVSHTRVRSSVSYAQRYALSSMGYHPS